MKAVRSAFFYGSLTWAVLILLYIAARGLA
jgi:hypothetical protein